MAVARGVLYDTRAPYMCVYGETAGWGETLEFQNLNIMNAAKLYSTITKSFHCRTTTTFVLRQLLISTPKSSIVCVFPFSTNSEYNPRPDDEETLRRDKSYDNIARGVARVIFFEKLCQPNTVCG